jgi:hypothetical protein
MALYRLVLKAARPLPRNPWTSALLGLTCALPYVFVPMGGLVVPALLAILAGMSRALAGPAEGS